MSKSASFSAEAQFSGRGAAEARHQTRPKDALNFLCNYSNYKAKDIIGKITNLFLLKRARSLKMEIWTDDAQVSSTSSYFCRIILPSEEIKT
jgi:hypothetical protein